MLESDLRTAAKAAKEIIAWDPTFPRYDELSDDLMAKAQTIARALLSLSSRLETAREVIEAADNYVRCARPHSGLSPYIRENGRHGSSPWAELCAALEAYRSLSVRSP